MTIVASYWLFDASEHSITSQVFSTVEEGLNLRSFKDRGNLRHLADAQLFSAGYAVNNIDIFINIDEGEEYDGDHLALVCHLTFCS